MSRIVGIAGRQGNCQEHKNVLDSLGVENKIVIIPGDLKKTTHLILPGGESTTQEMLWKKTGLWNEIKKFKNPILGTCAGAIHLAKILGNEKIHCERNAFGNQKESFYNEMDFGYAKKNKKLKAMFIRAPIIRQGKINANGSWQTWAKFKRPNEENEVLAVVKIGQNWLSTCHPEAVGDDTLHKVFLDL